MNKNLQESYIIEAGRTAVGKFMGALGTMPATELGRIVISSLVERSKIDPKQISEVIMGQVLTGGCGQNPARQASIKAGLNHHIPAYTINMVCGSGLKSVILAANSIAIGNSEIVIAGGQESMSCTNHAVNLRNPTKMGDAKLIDMMLKDGLSDAFGNYSMGITAENLAKKYNISREAQDEFAYQSQKKASEAKNTGRFKDEIIPVIIKMKTGDIKFDSDEYIREDTSLESLAKLKPAFLNEGTVTAGNSSGINDGAAAVIVASENFVTKNNIKPLAKITSSASWGVDPDYMGIGPVFAVREALAKANWQLQDIDLIEANEAFAAQSLAVGIELGLDKSKLNVNGGAIAIGHPIGASGARILTSLIYEMKRRNVKKSVATLCIGGGMGVAICLENV